ncbi:putative oxidoreductase YqkF [Weizmannia acidilactici]|uniref:Oxidoreductase YqkF n=1 Tax=Weizmannia acidilactici TaxID=2607726 RepID=A0A5J4JJX9_9BACI|nr:aldo/keto reductase [Weizmannia acidilactici]GER66091.1 putative oxidoreductase YqkF [Weizmannia acidilactici]GER69274.1 putative oxidoreductase YqkF [Weizmannia acidilactici]GER72400.1 putative oxidoreductase YqkF [Weizmannia acidilactici]
MEKNRLGNSNLYVSKLGLGCMSLGTDPKRARAIIETALEEGVNYFDTADLYDHGTNEKLVGGALKNVRGEVVIATKVGNRWNEDGKGWHWDPSKAYIKESVKQSLKRLGTDYIDLYQLHGGTIEDPIEETIEAFEELKAEGVIRYYGISSIRPNVIREYMKKSSIVSVMMQYSLLDRRPEETVTDLLEENGISIVARGPVAKGILSGKMMEKVPRDGYLDYTYEEIATLLEKIKEALLGGGRTMLELALQYDLACPTVASVVAGASSPDQVRANANAVNALPLTERELNLLREITKQNVYTAHR